MVDLASTRRDLLLVDLDLASTVVPFVLLVGVPAVLLVVEPPVLQLYR